MAAETKTKIIIAEIPPYDGEYEFDFDQAFSAREWRWIKKLSDGDLRPSSLTDLDLGDPDFVIALTVIAMRRAGKITPEQVLETAETLSDAPMDDAHITLVLGTIGEEDDGLPPASTTDPDGSSSSGSVENENSKQNSNENDGRSSRNDSDLSGTSPVLTGPMRSVTSSV